MEPVASLKLASKLLYPDRHKKKIKSSLTANPECKLCPAVPKGSLPVPSYVMILLQSCNYHLHLKAISFCKREAISLKNIMASLHSNGL